MGELGECVLAGAGVEHQQHFMRCGFVEFAQYTLYLFKLVHEAGMGVLTSGGVHDQYIRAARLGGLQGVERHRRRIRAGLLGDDRDTGAFTPGFELFHGRGSEGIGRRQHDLMAVLFQTIRQLGDRGGFAGAVDADGHDHERLACGIDGERLLAGLNDGAQVLSKHVDHRAVRQVPATAPGVSLTSGIPAVARRDSR